MDQRRPTTDWNPTAGSHLRTIILWRIGAAVLWGVVLQSWIVTCFQVLLTRNTGSWHPNLKLHNILIAPMYMVLLVYVVCAHGFILSKRFIRHPHMAKRYNRLSVIDNVLTLKFITFLGTHILTGSLYFFLYYHLGVSVSLIDNKVSTCEEDMTLKCLGESQLYLLLCGVWVGMFCFAKCRVIGLKVDSLSGFDFPCVQQKKFCSIITGLKPVLKKAVCDAILPSVCFVLVYLLLGNSIKKEFCDYFNFKANSESTISLSHVGLLLYSWLVCALYIFNSYILEHLLRVFLMQPIEFPIVVSLDNANSVILCDVLKMEEMPILQHLGYLDLMFVAGNDKVRRGQVFSLSQPGGHPHHWNAVLSECLRLIATFTNDLGTANDHYQKVIANMCSKESPALVSSRPTPTYNAIIPKPHMRNLSLCYEPAISFDAAVGSTKPRFTERVDNLDNAQLTFNLPFNVLKQKLFSNPLAKYLLDDRIEIQFHHIISLRGQLVIWATQSLAMFASASFNEDAYGVVQKGLPVIINTLLELKKTLDKIQKLGSYKKLDLNCKFDIKSKNALKSVIKRSLYKITLTFGDYIKDLPLSIDVHQHLQSYLALKEG